MASMPKVVYLMRHGEARHNLVDTGPNSYERRRDENLVDPPLTETGMAQVQAARGKVQEEPCWKADSPLVKLLVFQENLIEGVFRDC